MSCVLRVSRVGFGAALTVDLRACHVHLYHSLWGCMEQGEEAGEGRDEQRRCVLLALQCCEEVFLSSRAASLERVAAFTHRLLLLAAYLPRVPLVLAVLSLVERLLAAYPSLRSLCDEPPSAGGRFQPLLDDCDAANGLAQPLTSFCALQWSSDSRVVRAVTRILQPNPSVPVDRTLTSLAVCRAAEEEERGRAFLLPPPPSLTARSTSTKRKMGRALRPLLLGSDFLHALQLARASSGSSHARTEAQ